MRVKVITAVFAACALLAAPAVADPLAKAQHRAAHRDKARRLAGCPVHKTAEGELVDCRGWRFRGGAIGWDNTCLNLDYLPSAYACSSTSGW